MTKLQMVYLEMFLILFGFFYMFNAYQTVVLILVGWALVLASCNLRFDHRFFMRMLLFLGIQYILIAVCSLHVVFEHVFVLCAANTLVWESFMNIYHEGNSYLRFKMENIIYILILVYLGFIMLWIVLPKGITAGFAGGTGGSWGLLVMIQLLFVPAISRFILEKICYN